MRGGKKDTKVAKKKLRGLVRYLLGTDRRLIIQAINTGAWMSVGGNTVSVTVLDATEFWGFLCARYNVNP